MERRKPGELMSEGVQLYVKPVGDEHGRMWWKVQVPITGEGQQELIENVAQLAALEVKVNHGSHYPCCEILCPITPFDTIGHFLYRLAMVQAPEQPDERTTGNV